MSYEDKKLFFVGALLLIFFALSTFATLYVNADKMNEGDVKKILSIKNPYPAPKIEGVSNWINSDGENIQDLKGNVVLIDFWTYSCINCIRNTPFIVRWYEKYKDSGLKVIGIHTPEFDFEKETRNVEDAVKNYSIPYPVAQDNDFTTWNNFQNRYWPALYLIDKEGNVRHTHFGEGDYDQTEKVIRYLLEIDNEKDVENEGYSVPVTSGQTPETYLGYNRVENFANLNQLKKDEVVNYNTVDDLKTNFWTLSGKWKITAELSESQENNTKLSLKFSAKEVYLVMGSKNKAEVKVELTDKQQGYGYDVDENGIIKVDEYKLYRIVRFNEFKKDVQLTLTFPSNVELHAFTFGG